MTGFYDLDGFYWTRTGEGELCGPYDNEREALMDAEHTDCALCAAGVADRHLPEPDPREEH